MEVGWATAFFLCLFFNLRAAYKLLIDWKGMLTTLRFVENAYTRIDDLPDEAQIDRAPAAPTFVHLLPAYQEPTIVGTLSALLASRYPHGRLHVVVITRQEEDEHPHPLMEASTSELVRRFRGELPPYQQKMLSLLVMPGRGRKAHQLNWALRPLVLTTLLGEDYDPATVYIGVSDADSIPDGNVYRWIGGEILAGRTSLAYQGVTLSLANFDRLSLSGRVCAIQQSSIFIRVSIARLINEARRVRWFNGLARRAPRLATAIRPLFELCFRRAQICLGHNQFVRLDTLLSVGGFPTSGATEDSTLGYALAARGVLIAPLPLLELNDLPETKEKMVRQNARWYKGVLDDIGFLWREWVDRPRPFSLAQLCRHVGNKVVEWPIAAGLYPVMGFLGWHLAHVYRDQPVLFTLSLACPILSLGLGIWVGGLVTRQLVGGLTRYGPCVVDIEPTSRWARFSYTFRTQTYWLLATRGAWRVLVALARTGYFEPRKTDRISG
jgi:cellulose synthase/poly-beta-1,6-N-acetylglucosamine synthase-like glycosyltransferase